MKLVKQHFKDNPFMVSLSLILIFALLFLLLNVFEIWVFNLPWGRLSFWQTIASWFLAISVITAALTWRVQRKRLYEAERRRVHLEIQVFPPDSPETNYTRPTIAFTNQGKRVLVGTVEFYVYPNQEGRQGSRNPIFREEMREKMKKQGSAVEFRLRLAPGETEHYPYRQPPTMNSMGLHRYVPQWLYFEESYHPEGLEEIKKSREDVFYLLYLPGQEDLFSGEWAVTKMTTEVNTNQLEEIREDFPELFHEPNEREYLESWFS